MLLFPITHLDIDKRQPRLKDELPEDYIDPIYGKESTVSYTGGKWYLEHSTATFTESLEGKYGVVIGGWSFVIIDWISTTKLEIGWCYYPVEFKETDIAGNTSAYSIGGFALQLQAGAEEINTELQNAGIFPEAIMWTLSNRGQFNTMFTYKAIALICECLGPGDWKDLYVSALKKYEKAFRKIVFEYNPDEEPEDVKENSQKLINVTFRR